jgi:hypothetical protein
MLTIDARAQRYDTNAFVTTETIDPLARKLIGIVGDRRMTKARRYLGDSGGVPDVYAGLRLERGGISGPVEHRSGEAVIIRLASRASGLQGISFGIHVPGEDEAEVSRRYQHPENEWMGQRRNITYVELRGWPGNPRRDDHVRIEWWNEYGVGQEVIIVFDDVDLVDELARQIKGDPGPDAVLWDKAYCEAHDVHLQDPEHRRGGCSIRPATLAEDLAALAQLAARQVD